MKVRVIVATFPVIGFPLGLHLQSSSLSDHELPPLNWNTTEPISGIITLTCFSTFSFLPSSLNNTETNQSSPLDPSTPSLPRHPFGQALFGQGTT